MRAWASVNVARVRIMGGCEACVTQTGRRAQKDMITSSRDTTCGKAKCIRLTSRAPGAAVKRTNTVKLRFNSVMIRLFIPTQPCLHL